MNCLLCGEECGENKDKRRIKKFCCREHYLEYMKMQREVPKSYCLNCGEPIFEVSHKKEKIKKFCCNKCRGEFQHKSSRKFTICNFCGESFEEKRNAPNLYCSRSCATNARKMNDLVYDTMTYSEQDVTHKDELIAEFEMLVERAIQIQHRIKHEKICVVCGNQFIAKTTNQVCCCERCSKTRDNSTHDKRLKRNGKPDLSISLTKLYERDGGICQLCGRHIDFDCDSNADHYPSIDHIIPLAKGGMHIWDNVQLACRICNSLKRDHI